MLLTERLPNTQKLDQNHTNAEVEKPCCESMVSQKRLKGYVNMDR